METTDRRDLCLSSKGSMLEQEASEEGGMKKRLGQ